MIKKVLIAYFTGTGGTKRAAETFEKDLLSRGLSLRKHEIKTGRLIDNGDEDLLILLFAVHAANAPMPVYHWLEAIKKVNRIPAVVVSVSAGGEVTPNTACRISTIRRLEKKGYTVVYEQTLVMPSDIFVSAPDEVSVKLLEILPQKVQKIDEEVLSGVLRRVKPKKLDRFLSFAMEMEKMNTKAFAKRLYTDDKCTGCGWCESKCPANNITIEDHKPVFHKQCVMCYGCIYGCPENAIQAKMFRFSLIKGGFDIDALEKRTLNSAVKLNLLPKGTLWKGVRKYLLHD